MKLIFFTFWTILATNFIFSQNDTLNLLNSANEKTGWWITYLDKNLATTTDKSLAKYYSYSYFDGKFNYYNMGPIGSDKNPVIAPDQSKSNVGIPPLDGEYKANYSNGQTKYVLIAQNGRFLEYKEFYDNGNLKTRFDYTESCGDTVFHYCIYLYKKDGSLKTKTTIRTPKK